MLSSKIECAIIRGGTTKGVYINGNELPENVDDRDRLILSLFGSPDTRQINGIGGADPLTSKVAIIKAASVPGADIDYTSGEVGIDEAAINYSTMCGNLASGAALFAIEFGLVSPVEPITEVRIHNLNTGKRITALVPIRDGLAVMSLSKPVDGVSGYGCDLSLKFHDPAGSITGELLPTGGSVDEIRLPDGQMFPVSIVDCGTLYGFLSAQDLGISGEESSRELDNNELFKDLVELVREEIAKLISEKLGRTYLSRQVKVAVVSQSLDHEGDTRLVEHDIVARVINRYKTHKAYPVTGAICLSAAAAIKGTLVQRVIGDTEHSCMVRISHPSGSIPVLSRFSCEEGICRITETEVRRSARVLMRGIGFVCQ